MKSSLSATKLGILIALIAGNVGCQSGLVSIQTIKPVLKPVLKMPTSSDSGAEKQGTLAPGNSAFDKAVYFLSVANERTLSVTAINFISSNSTTGHPFGFHLQSAGRFDQFFWRPVTYNETNYVSWVEFSRSPQPHLKTIDTSTFAIEDRGEIFPAINWSISSDGDWVAGVQADGRAMIQNIASGNMLHFLEKDLSKTARCVHLSSRKQVAVIDPSAQRVDLFSIFEPEKIIKSWSSSLFSASPSGKYVLTGDNHQIQITELDSGDAIPIADEVTDLRFPQWKNDEAIAFISGPTNRPQIRVLDLKKGLLSPIAPLNASNQEESLVCPTWVKENLFFADRTRSADWGIWKVEDPISKISVPKLFVQPEGTGKGYACPLGNMG